MKEPAVVTQRNFDAKTMPPEEVERVKLQDGVRMHEATKVELKTYARTQGLKEVKPFMQVIARDTTHAGNLLAVESVDEPTEIVIHVNMLKEDWDVTSLYTIVPLRAANARWWSWTSACWTSLRAARHIDEPY